MFGINFFFVFSLKNEYAYCAAGYARATRGVEADDPGESQDRRGQLLQPPGWVPAARGAADVRDLHGGAVYKLKSS